MADSFALSLTEVDILSQTLGVNLRLFPFEIPSFGRLQVDRKRIAKSVFANLAQRGLIRYGELDPDLSRAVRTVADYRIAVAAMGQLEEGKQLFARASATAETGVLAVQEGDRLRLELIRPTALAVTMVGLLPTVDAGPGQSVTVTKPAVVGGRGDDDDGVFKRGSSADPVLRIVEGYVSRPRTGSGFFAVSGKDRYGREIRAGELGWMDTDAGRYLNLSRPPGEDGQVHGTFSPADPVRLTQHLGQLIESVAPRD
jgi:hypothetical protein